MSDRISVNIAAPRNSTTYIVEITGRVFNQVFEANLKAKDFNQASHFACQIIRYADQPSMRTRLLLNLGGDMRKVLSKCDKDKLQRMQQIVCQYYEIEPKYLLSKKRHRSASVPRQVYMWLATRHTDMSLPVIGLFFKRDHSTIIHARRTVEAKYADEARLVEKLFLSATKHSRIPTNKVEAILMHEVDYAQ